MIWKRVTWNRSQSIEDLLTSIDDIGYFPPSEARANSIFVSDDVACGKQEAVREYFSMGRYTNVDRFYLCQIKLPKHLIRDVNLLVLFKQDNTNLKYVYNDHVNTDMSYDKFFSLCRNWWSKYGQNISSDRQG